MSDKLRVILVCHKGENQAAYLKALELAAIEVCVVEGFSEGQDVAIEEPVSGLLVDLKTKVLMSQSEKDVARTVMDVYPTAHLTLDKDSGEVRALAFGGDGGGKTVEDFVNAFVKPFPPRRMRRHPRYSLHYNLLISRFAQVAPAVAERAVTLDVSFGGCCILTPYDWAKGDSVFVMFQELQQDKPVRTVVKWVKPWGKGLVLPAIGVEFQDAPGDLLESLIHMAVLKNQDIDDHS